MPATFTINALTHEWDSKTDGDKITGTCVWLVRASEPVTPYQAERAGAPITPIGGSMPGTPSGFVPCVDRSAKASDQTRMLYKVTCSYDSTRQETEDPLDEPAKITTDADEFEETYFADKSDPVKYAVMTSGEPFGELPKRDAARRIITIEKNVPAETDDSDYDAYLDPVLNSGNVTIRGLTYTVGQLKTTPPKLSEIQERNGIEYRVFSIKLKANVDGWDQKYESRGLYFRHFDGSNYVMRRATDADGNPVEQPVALDEDGFPLAPGTPGFEIVLKPYEYDDFSMIPVE